MPNFVDVRMVVKGIEHLFFVFIEGFLKFASFRIVLGLRFA